jgi:hypothetical protein
MKYDVAKSIAYAKRWAKARNPAFYNFDNLGGDCTNFVSQCIYAGAGVMNFTKDTGWYYISVSNRAAAWTGVGYLYKFLLTNKGVGPYGVEVGLENVEVGDIIQLSFDGTTFTHSCLVMSTYPTVTVAQHTYDYVDRPLSTHNYKKIRVIRIEGVRSGT